MPRMPRSGGRGVSSAPACGSVPFVAAAGRAVSPNPRPPSAQLVARFPIVGVCFAGTGIWSGHSTHRHLVSFSHSVSHAFLSIEYK